MADVQPLFIGSDGLPTEMQDTDSLDLGALDMSGDITMNSNEVTGLPATPSGSTAATSKAYVDAIASGLHLKETARLATTAALSTWSASGSGVGKTLQAPDNSTSYNDFDGITAALNDRVLVKDGGPNATPAIDNGIYYVSQLGDGATQPCILTRATDFDTTAEAKAGSFLWVAEGNTQADTQWGVTTDDPITVDTTPINWTQISGPGTYVGGNGIDITTNTISVDPATGAVIQPGLQFGTGADAGKLAVLPDGTKGIEVGAAGVAVKVDGSTISFDGSGQLEVLAATIAEDLKEEVVAFENVSAGDPVHWGGADDQVRESQAGTSGRETVIGVMEDTVTATNSGTMVKRGTCLGVLTGATRGDSYFLAAAGGLSAPNTPPTGTGNVVVLVGYARSDTDLDVIIQVMGRRA
jgi:hypothetical protein